MFRWYYTYAFEMDAPIQKIWKVCADPSNWPKWIDQFESCHFDGEIKAGSIIKCKVKTRFPKDVYIPIRIVDLKPYREGISQVKCL